MRGITLEDRLEAMSSLGITASEAGESLRKVTLAMKKLKKRKSLYRQWQQPYRYHR
jgi:hypothetical protein